MFLNVFELNSIIVAAKLTLMLIPSVFRNTSPSLLYVIARRMLGTSMMTALRATSFSTIERSTFLYDMLSWNE